MHKYIVSLALAGACSPHAFAEPPVPPGASLSLAAAYERVLQSNPELRAAAREIQAQDGLVIQAGSMPNPELSALIEDHKRDTRTTTFQLSQPIELGGKRGARVDAAERGRDVAMAELAIKSGELRAATTDAFYAVLVAQQRYRLAEESQQLADSSLAAASKRVLAGKSSPVDETKAGIGSATARIELAQASADLASARMRLVALWDGTEREFGGVDGQLDKIPETGPVDALMRRLQQSPGMQRARIEVERRLAMARLERTRRYPDITLSVGTKREELLGRTQATFGLALPLPMFDRNQGNLQEAVQRSDKARDELAATGIRLGSELTRAHSQLNVAREQAQLLQRDILPAAASAFDAARKGFDYGKFAFLDVIDAQRTLVQAKSQHLRALGDAYRAVAEVERLLGITLTAPPHGGSQILGKP
jgi:cobalt-zinc-cadmium efflux system outer membrane protein